MYAGEIVEQTDVRTLFKKPRHPYTQGLIGSVPTLGTVKEELDVIPGVVPTLVDLPPGCRFAARCKARVEHDLEICLQLKPELLPIEDGHLVRCWLYHNEDGSLSPREDRLAGASEGGVGGPAAPNE
ncbi:MAG: hypothetical protein Q8Q52_05205 [Acidimicrobiia bacterium]|nr:hypothetical protein [Acidimicrobiia bacterium]